MTEARHTCPDCGFIDLMIEGEVIRKAECPNCGWMGPLQSTIGVATTEQLWGIERVGNVLLRTIAIHAAGPLVQALEFIGLLPKKRSTTTIAEATENAQWNQQAQMSRDAVMQKITEAAVTAAFEEAERQNYRFAKATGAEIHPLLRAEAKKEREEKRKKRRR